jgi:hypothetical protein
MRISSFFGIEDLHPLDGKKAGFVTDFDAAEKIFIKNAKTVYTTKNDMILW